MTIYHGRFARPFDFNKANPEFCVFLMSLDRLFVKDRTWNLLELVVGR